MLNGGEGAFSFSAAHRLTAVGVHGVQVIMGLVENGSAEKVMTYVQKVSYQPDWGNVIGACIRTNPQAAQQLASTVVNAGVTVRNNDHFRWQSAVHGHILGE